MSRAIIAFLTGVCQHLLVENRFADLLAGLESRTEAGYTLPVGFGALEKPTISANCVVSSILSGSVKL